MTKAGCQSGCQYCEHFDIDETCVKGLGFCKLRSYGIVKTYYVHYQDGCINFSDVFGDYDEDDSREIL